jgi:phosphatidylserine decarboxylase
MRIHKEGTKILLITAILVVAINIFAYTFLQSFILVYGIVFLFSILVYILILNFFRNPLRKPVVEEGKIISPADGKVVVIEEVEEKEFFNDKRLMISIFMSIYDVHINWFPISGIIKYFKYHPGKFLVAWNPKSSEDNERTTIVLESKNGVQVLFRQIAGAVARRIVYNVKEGENVKQSSEMGFIRFGSRLDVYLPLGTKVDVELNQKVTGSISSIAHLE